MVGGISVGTVKALAPKSLPEAGAGVVRPVGAGREGADWTAALSLPMWEYAQIWAATVATASLLTTALQRKAEDELGGAAADIFEAQHAIVSDPMLEASVFSRVEEGIPLPQAVSGAITEIVAGLEASDDEATRARAEDVYDVGLRFITTLAGIGAASAMDDGQFEPVLVVGGSPSEEGVLVAHDLLPSELVMLNRKMMLGLVLEAGSVHSSIDVIAEALGIPVIIQAAGVLSGLVDGESIIVDADNGTVILEPYEDELKEYASRILKAGHQTFYQATQAIMHDVRKPPESLS